GYTVEVANLASCVNERILREFLDFCGAIEHVEVVRNDEQPCKKAYVTFKNSHAMETAVLLSDSSSSSTADSTSVAKRMAGKGYVLGKDALGRAREFDESHQITARVAELSRKSGVSGKVSAGIELVKRADRTFDISNRSKSAAYAAGNAAVSAANYAASSSYFSKGALWVSGALSRASRVAADLGSHG
ncbi:hypothetical protein M569_00981, partial [Genlisea aurea]